jgi:hypothetical protein
MVVPEWDLPGINLPPPPPLPHLNIGVLKKCCKYCSREVQHLHSFSFTVCCREKCS